MLVLDPRKIKVNFTSIEVLETELRNIYRLIIFSREHHADDLLNAFLQGINSFKEQLGIKNAQLEAQTPEEVNEYLKNLQKALIYITGEIRNNVNFTNQLQLFRLFKLISPEAHSEHPNHYRRTEVQIGPILCPHSSYVPSLMEELFYRLNHFPHPILKAIYFHHEMIRIHPFVDSNGRVARIGKNWMLMHSLYPPIFINTGNEKKDYIRALQNSFLHLEKNPGQWNDFTEAFFEQEIERLLKNVRLLYRSVKELKKNEPQLVK